MHTCSLSVHLCIMAKVVCGIPATRENLVHWTDRYAVGKLGSITQPHPFVRHLGSFSEAKSMKVFFSKKNWAQDLPQEKSMV